jgi:excisionase family DNA binding protein
MNLHMAGTTRTGDDTRAPLTIPEAAQALALSIHTLRTWIANRRLAHIKLGRSVRIPQHEIDRLLDGGLVPARCGYSRGGRKTG